MAYLKTLMIILKKLRLLLSLRLLWSQGNTGLLFTKLMTR